MDEIKFFDENDEDIEGLPEIELREDPEIDALYKKKFEELIADVKKRFPNYEIINIDDE